MINVTLPDEKSNYVHRIGRVGRAERMGLAISLVATVPEKVIGKYLKVEVCCNIDNLFFVWGFLLYCFRFGIMVNGARLVAVIVTILI